MVNLSFPLQTYTQSNKPSVDTLKVDLSALEDAHNDLDTLFAVEHNADGTHDEASLSTIKLNAPQGFLINGKISVTDSGSGLVVAIKTLAGTDPSSTDPVYCRIGDTVRTISAALSHSVADGTNWLNAGSAELATKEIDYFCFLGWSTVDSAVHIGFSRWPTDGTVPTAGTTNEKGCCVNGSMNSGDTVEVIGRFAATLSAGAGYTWSVPTFTAANLIQRPIYETRWLTWAPTFAGWSANPTVDWAQYKIQGNNMLVSIGTSAGTSNATTATFTVPFAILNYPLGSVGAINNSAALAAPAKYAGTPASATITLYSTYANAAWTSSGAKSFVGENMVFKI